jgi:methylmalonyl-CoA/ethylmalonyl-CoA epimerase
MILAMAGSDPLIELIVPLHGPSIYHDFKERQGTGLHHLGYYVDDLAATTRRMAAAGYAMVQSGRATGQDGTGAYAYYDTYDELGYFLEAVVVPRVRRPPHRVWPEAR